MMKTSRILGWLLLVGVVFATLAPIGLRPVTDAPVSLERFGAYAVVSFLFAFGYPRHRWQVLGLLVMIAGAMEAMQNLELTRHGYFGDFAVKAAGCWFGVMLAVVLAFIPASMAKAEGRA
ncbi:VanZ family protein [Methylobacterium sp. WL103]|uniref:VanZ family protein n=1 Tax=unclassified Methylobacterium TaxID=2615210 RepID=UPI0011CB0CAD|nr:MULTISPECIES: VanZ family protein [unclassified Methylobacterium]TXM65633.1 VanZ family protein [Methylobacterium sp. WL12]TXN07681.1 VanZ family protein [Methylobacterium sp. WL103]